MNNQIPNILNGRYPGNFSTDGDKLRIVNNQGMSSVLFEDISSISFKSYNSFDVVKLFSYLFGGSLLFIILLVIGGINESGFIMFLGFIILIGSFIYSFTNNKFKIKWDNVIIETRGGLLLFYSVNFGEGINQVNKIEVEKRRLTSSK